MSAHTPGRNEQKCRTVEGELCALHDAAPELLAALKSIAEDLETGFIGQDSARAERNRNKQLTMARAAIAKATGA